MPELTRPREPTSVLQGSEDVVGQGKVIRSGSATLTSTTHDPYEDPSAQVSGLTLGIIFCVDYYK